MRSYRKKFQMAAVIAAVLLAATLPGGAFAAVDAKNCVVEEGLLYALDAKGQKKQVEGAEVVKSEFEYGGEVYWLAADPESDEEFAKMYEGWKIGIYFFGQDGKFISFLEREAPEMSYVRFSPDGEHFVLDSGTYVDREYKLYQFAGLELKKTFYGMTQQSWLDPVRFAFTYIDTARGPRHKDADISGWISVVVYDRSTDELETVKAATATEDYQFDSVDGSELLITKYSVKNAKDWANEEARKVEEIRALIPAAG